MQLTRRINACTTLTDLHSELNRAAAIWERVSDLPRYEDHGFWDFLEIDPDELSDQVIEPDFPARSSTVVAILSDLYPHWIAWARGGLLVEAEDIRKNPIFLIEPWPGILDKLEMHLMDYHRAFTEEQEKDARRFVGEMREYI